MDHHLWICQTISEFHYMLLCLIRACVFCAVAADNKILVLKGASTSSYDPFTLRSLTVDVTFTVTDGVIIGLGSAAPNTVIRNDDGVIRTLSLVRGVEMSTTWPHVWKLVWTEAQYQPTAPCRINHLLRWFIMWHVMQSRQLPWSKTSPHGVLLSVDHKQTWHSCGRPKYIHIWIWLRLWKHICMWVGWKRAGFSTACKWLRADNRLYCG